MTTTLVPAISAMPRRRPLWRGVLLALLLALVAGAAPRSALADGWAKRTYRRMRGKVREAFTRKTPTKVSAQAAAQLIRPGEHVFLPLGHQVAASVLKALSVRAADKNGGLSAEQPVHLIGLSNTASTKLFEKNTKIVADSLFLGANTRTAVNAGLGDFRPGVFLSRIPRLIKEGKLPVNVALVQVSPPDARGYVSLGATAGATLAAIKKAKVVIAEVNRFVPVTKGATRIHQSKLDYVVSADRELREIPRAKIGETERAIAKNVLKLIPEKKPTLQFGIGAIPDAVAEELGKAGRKDLHVHSEMISDGVMHLVNSGAVKGKVRYTFAMGSGDFLKWLNDNDRLEARTADWTNDPARIAKIKNFVAVNGAVSVDLKGQVNAQYINGHWYSGHGGQVDFMTGAMRSKGGRAIIALPSAAKVSDPKKIAKDDVTFKVNGQLYVSRIKPTLGNGDVVTTSMGEVQYVVTEHGIAQIDGTTARERAEALISVAHPAARDKLRAALHAEEKGRNDTARAKIKAREDHDTAKHRVKPADGKHLLVLPWYRSQDGKRGKSSPHIPKNDI